MKALSRIMRFVLNGIRSAANKALGAVPLFKDIVFAVSNLTRSVNDLIKGYTQLAKMVIEDRDAINDLYQHVNDLQQDRIDAMLLEGSSSEAPATTSPPVRPKDPSRIDTSWSEGDKKKMVN